MLPSFITQAVIVGTDYKIFLRAEASSFSETRLRLPCAAVYLDGRRRGARDPGLQAGDVEPLAHYFRTAGLTVSFVNTYQFPEVKGINRLRHRTSVTRVSGIESGG